MNGAHDLGGAHGFGPVVPEPDEPVFHDYWERRVFAMTIAMGATGTWTLDASRFAREDQAPRDYLAETYYEVWLSGLLRLLADHELLGHDELVGERSQRPATPIRRRLAQDDVADVLRKGGPSRRDPAAPARFAVGDRVRTRNTHPRTHTRLPRYARGRLGVVEQVRGCHVFPDTNAHGYGEQPHWLYTVAFEATELWGDDADPTVTVSVDAFEPYLSAP